jgi:SPX domain protein involved in polyphosphate accumulation
MALFGLVAWKHALQTANDIAYADNVDYNDIKYFIKERTTPGEGGSISVPGRGDETLKEFERELFTILRSQHNRINDFVKCKSTEIQRRLEQSRGRLRQLAGRTRNATEDQRIPLSRLERFGKLENDVVKAGDELKLLTRFTTAQRTAFRKLLKKYKKWTGSTELESRFRTEVLSDPKSFTHLDLGPFLDEYNALLQEIRELYEERVQASSGRKSQTEAQSQAGPAVVAQLQTAVESGSKVEFDAAIASVPLGERGTFASYFVHPDSLVELQVLLLQHARYYMSRSRSNSINSPVSPSFENGIEPSMQFSPDYFALEADDAERFAREQNRLTVTEHEHQPGSTPQKAKLCARWNRDEEAHVAFGHPGEEKLCAKLKKKHVQTLLDREGNFSAKKAALSGEDEPILTAIRRQIENDETLKTHYSFTSCRSRFLGIDNSQKRITLATLDTSLTIKTPGDTQKYAFPYALLLIRQEDTPANGGILAALDNSHLVERVRGFSLEYHAIWQTRQSTDIPAPFWLPILDRDIRKLPPPAIRISRKRSSATGSVIQSPDSNESVNGGPADSTTAVETARSEPSDELEAPAIRSFRKKRRRGYTRQEQDAKRQEQQQRRYWSEYDHPDSGDEDGEAFVLYIDPNAPTAWDRFVDRLIAFFSHGKDPEKDNLLPSPTRDDVDSSEDEAQANTTPQRRRKQNLRATTYGTISHLESQTYPPERRWYHILPQFPAIAFAASLSILLIAFILALTGKKKLAYEVDFGVLFASGASLLFAIMGFLSLVRREEVEWPGWVVGTLVLGTVVLGNGGLIARMVG